MCDAGGAEPMLRTAEDAERHDFPGALCVLRGKKCAVTKLPSPVRGLTYRGDRIMRKTSKRAWPRLRQLFKPPSYLDSWFELLERSRAALDRLLDYGWLLKKRSAYQRQPNFLPHVEGLETRVLMTNVLFHTATQSVNYNAVANVEVDLDSSSGQTITVHYATADGTGTAGVDYTNTSGTLTFTPGMTTDTFTVPMLGHKQTGNKNFTITLSSPVNATLGTPQTDTLTIVETLLTSAVVDRNKDVVLPTNFPREHTHQHLRQLDREPGRRGIRRGGLQL